MKKALVILSILALTACKSKKEVVKAPEVKTVVVNINEVEKAKKDNAYQLGKRVLMTCNTSKFKPFTSSEATPSVIQNTTQERLTKTCHKFRVKYGDFKDIHLAQVIKDVTTNSYIFRYKADYQRKFVTKELRVTINAENKVAAIKSTDWTDEFK